MVLDQLPWVFLPYNQLNYIKIPVILIDPTADLAGANELLNEIDQNNFSWRPFCRSKSGGLARRISNYDFNRADYWQRGGNRAELVLFDCNRGFCRVQFGAVPKDDKGNLIVGTKALRQLINKIPIINDYVETDEKQNNYYRQEAKKFYRNPDEGGFLGIPTSATCYNDQELDHVWSLDVHWAFPSALAKILNDDRATEVLNELYLKRKTNDIIKSMGVAAIGTMCSDFTTNMGLGAKGALAKLRYQLLEFHAAKMKMLREQIEAQGGIILNMRIDSIKFIATHRLTIAGEGSELGRWSYEFEDCRYRQATTGKYEYIDNDGVYHAKVNGATVLDRFVARDQWTWGDIYRCGDPIGVKFNLLTRRFEELHG